MKPLSLQSIYFHLPVFAQNLATNAASLKNRIERYGGSFDSILEGYRKRATWSSEQMSEFQSMRLKKMVSHCYETVPYYRRIFDEGGINPASIRYRDDLARLPILTKSIVNACPQDFLSSSFADKRLVKRHTSGTTGSSFQFVMNREAFMEQWAVTWRYWEGLGIFRGTPHAVFGTRRIVPPEQKQPPFWREKRPDKQLYFSAFHESDANMEVYFKEIDRQGFAWIHGYPSIVTPLAAYMVRTDKRFHRPLTHVTLAAENLLLFQKELMREAFGVDPRMHYGSTEGVAQASQDAAGVLYIDEDYAVLETVALSKDSDTQEIVGTSLTNFAMPLLRWRMGDAAVCKVDSSGRRYLDCLDGRSEDYVFLPDGRKLGKLDHVFKDTRAFREAQIKQNADYSLELRVVAPDGRAPKDEEIALRELRESGFAGPVSFHYMDVIPKTKAGKLRFVISDVAESGQGNGANRGIGYGS